jgi:hypothetical protein
VILTRQLPNGWPAWSLLVVAAVAPLNLLALWTLAGSWQVGVGPDFQQYADALDRFLAGAPLYGPEWKWRYSPAALITMWPGIALGLVGWSVLHAAAVALVRPWWLAGLMALSWPFWVDVVSGNTVTFVAVAGIAAMRGSTIGTYTYWWLSLVIPRPFQLPLMVYLAWRRRDLWRGLLALVVAHVVLVLVIGQGPEWVAYLLERGAENTGEAFNVHPAADLGWGWLLLGIPLAALLTWRGWPGLAGVVLSPSLLAQYLLFAFVPPGPAVQRAEGDVTARGGHPPS